MVGGLEDFDQIHIS